MNFFKRIIMAIFKFVFGKSKDSSKKAAPQLSAAVKSISKIGAKRLKETLLAIPIFVLFVRELLINRKELNSEKQLLVVGAAAALSTLGLVVTVGLLGSLPFQLLLLVTNPFFGVALLLSSGLVITTVVIVIVWLIIYVLNCSFSDDPTFQKIYKEFVPPSAQDILNDLQADIESEGADLDSLQAVIEERLISRASKADAKKLENKLKRLENKFKGKAFSRISNLINK